MMERIPRSFEKKLRGTTGEITFTGREQTTSVIKTEFVEEEYAGWKQISAYLKTLPTKKIIRDGQPELIVRFLDSDTVSSLAERNDPLALEGFDAFFSDLTLMWNETRMPFDGEKLKRDYARIALEVMPKFETLAQERLGGVGVTRDIVVDGKSIGSIQDFFDIQRRGFSIEPPSLVLSHGDENLANVLVPKDRSVGPYRVIDARFAGYYDQAWVLGNIFSRTYLFNAKFPQDVHRDTDDIDGTARFSSAFPEQTPATLAIQGRVMAYLKEHAGEDPSLVARTSAYVANNIGRSIAFLRDKSFRDTCEKYGVQHFLTAMIESREIALL